MRRNLTTLLLLFVLLSMTAQNITFEGHVIDDEKNELIAATVRYFVDDSMLVKGVTTDSKGEFKFEVLQNERASKLVFSYIGYKELVMNIQPTKESTVRLGDIVMKKDAVQIHEVTVLGENQVRTEDKLMVYPTKDELRHAYDGYSALDALMVPGLNVNTFNHSINYMNQTVLLCINGREATQDEVRDLNAKYIKRVDIYQMGKP
ncbi:MAG: carboxypeptidase-like regulatory domain-containing protein, partial [Prevotella sp.]|nr:carboxypeptidase-like regulatory domain-containing protein [Prevotella sp.]